MNSPSSYRMLLLALVLSSVPTSGMVAQVNVFLDFADFQLRLDDATTSAGVSSFSSAEVDEIRNNVIADIALHYEGYSLTFSETDPGGDFETMAFGWATTTNSYGSADSIDFRNQIPNGMARIFTANFDDFLEVGDTRSQQILEISTSLAGTASHELGHNLGLQHFDAYGIASYTATNFNGSYKTNGAQNRHTMATSGTGMHEEEREVFRPLSDLSGVKLHMANGVSSSPISLIAETGGSHGSAGSAQHIELTSVAFGSDYDDASILQGFFNNSDYYSVDLDAGDKILIEILGEILYENDFDSLIRLYDVDGTTVLFENDDMEINQTGVNDGGPYTFDAMLWNVPVANTGRYFVEVDSFGSGDSGNYELLLAVERLTAIPEPCAVFFLSAVLAGSAMHRRRRRFCC